MKELRKKRKQAEDNRVPSSSNLPFPWKTKTVFRFDSLRVDVCGLCLSRTFPVRPQVSSRGSSCGDHRSPTLKPEGSEGERPTTVPPFPGHWGGPQAPPWPIRIFQPPAPVINNSTRSSHQPTKSLGALLSCHPIRERFSDHCVLSGTSMAL